MWFLQIFNNLSHYAAMSSTPDRDVERDIDNGDALLDATNGEQVCPGNSSSARTGSEVVGSGNQRGLR